MPRPKTIPLEYPIERETVPLQAFYRYVADERNWRVLEQRESQTRPQIFGERDSIPGGRELLRRQYRGTIEQVRAGVPKRDVTAADDRKLCERLPSLEQGLRVEDHYDVKQFRDVHACLPHANVPRLCLANLGLRPSVRQAQGPALEPLDTTQSAPPGRFKSR
jgi:hypothetical protein